MESRSDQQCMQRWNILEKNRKKEVEQRAAAEAMDGAEPEEGDKRKRVRNASTKGLAKQESTVSDRRRVPKTRGSRAEGSTRGRRSSSIVMEDDNANQVPEEAKARSADRVPEEAVRQ